METECGSDILKPKRSRICESKSHLATKKLNSKYWAGYDEYYIQNYFNLIPYKLNSRWIKYFEMIIVCH